MLSKYFIGPELNVKEAVSYMEENAVKAVIIAKSDHLMMGLFTLGDMRHYFLNNGSLMSNITCAMNKTPIVFHSQLEAEQYPVKLIIYPIVNDDNEVIDIIADDNQNQMSDALKDVPVVIMAGGKGTRLYPYTKVLPKALIPIGDYTITERIIHNFCNYGCKDFYLILNHKAEMIKSYFNDIKKDYNVHYVIEEKFLGTGGGLAYLKGQIHTTFFLSNCDILVNADLKHVYDTHVLDKNIITLVCAMKDIVIPYGIVETSKDGRVTGMKEKPEYSFLTNTGMYILEPDIINRLDKDTFIHMTDIAQECISHEERVGVFPVSEKAWMDMGQFSEMESMIKRLGL